MEGDRTMKTRWKILIAIGAALLCSWLVQEVRPYAIPTPTAAMNTKELRAKYTEFNARYFDNALPPVKNIELDYGEYNPRYMAQTHLLPGKTFHIGMNESYALAERNADLILLHEMCHIKSWDLDVDAEGTITPHGQVWRSCMLELDRRGAFRVELIDGYEQGDL